MVCLLAEELEDVGTNQVINRIYEKGGTMNEIQVRQLGLLSSSLTGFPDEWDVGYE